MTDFSIAALVRKWCPSIDTLNRLACTDHAELKKEVEDSITAAVREALEEVEKIAHRFATHPAPVPMTEWARGAIQSARDIFFAIAALRKTDA